MTTNTRIQTHLSIIPLCFTVLAAVSGWNISSHAVQGASPALLQSGASSAIERSIDGLAITLDVRPASGISVYAVEETLPSGFGAENISQNGSFDAVNRKIKWGPFFDNQSRAFQYQLVPPNGFSGTSSLAGLASFDGVDVLASGPDSVMLGNTGSEADPEPGESPVTRSVQGNDGVLNIQLAVRPAAQTQVHALEENVPPGFVPSGMTDGGFFDEGSRKIKWGPFFDAQTRDISYALTSPAGFAGEVSLIGLGSFDGKDTPVGGSSTVTIGNSNTGSNPDPEPGESPVTRSVQGNGGVINIQLTVRPGAQTQVHAMEENVPPGFVPSSMTDGGSFDAGSGKIKWGPFFDAQARDISYALTSPAGFAGEISFIGLGSFDGSDVRTGGAQSHTVEGQQGPTVPNGRPAELEITVVAGVWVSGTIGAEYIIQASDSLNPNTWIELDRIILVKDPELWVDVESPNFPKRFYRAERP